MEDFVKEYTSSNANILLLYGPPGTGKTSFLRELLTTANESCLITYNKDIASLDILFSYFYDSPERFLIIEDADTYLNSRSHDGNDVIKKLLNITDGLTSRKDKFVIFTTNLASLGNVDEALLREGRCFETLHIDALTKEQAINVLNKKGIDPSILPENTTSITLANLYALVSGRSINKATTNLNTGFGFKA